MSAKTPDQLVVSWLKKYGHFENPGKPKAYDAGSSGGIQKLTFGDEPLRQAIESIQELDGNFNVCCKSCHNRPGNPDGDFGVATMQLMSMPRCGTPDYSRAEATGAGSWPVPGCNPSDPERATVHSVRVYVDARNASSTQRGYLEWCKLAWQHCCAEFGLRVAYVDSADQAELTVEFGHIPGNTIGWFLVLNKLTCHQTLNGKLDTGYNPDKFMFATLGVHELFWHGLGGAHTNGGIGNPSILRTPISSLGYPTFNNDGSRGNSAWIQLGKWFGGEAVSIKPGGGDGGGNDAGELWFSGVLQAHRGGNGPIAGEEFIIQRK